MSDGYSFQILTEINSGEIVSLRKRSYSRQFKSELDSKGLDWNDTDKISTHLGLFSPTKELVSTIRITFFTNKKNLENSTCILTPEHVLFPCALLSRAATCPNHSNRGLHQILRLVSLEYISMKKCSCVLGTMKKNSERIKSLIEIGYNIIHEAERWMNSFISSNDPIVLIGLVNEFEIQEAIRLLRTKTELHNYKLHLSLKEN